MYVIGPGFSLKKRHHTALDQVVEKRTIAFACVMYIGTNIREFSFFYYFNGKIFYHESTKERKHENEK